MGSQKTAQHPQASSPVTLQIESRYPEFNPVMKKIANYILSSMDKAAYMGISELASVCKVSVASITRFVRQINFKNFKAFQLELAQTANGRNVREVPPVNNRITFEYGGTSPNDSAEVIAKKVFQSNIQMLVDTMGIIDYLKIKQVSDIISGARNIIFFGVGLSYITAEQGRTRFNRLGINSFSYSDTQEMIVAATTCTDKDVFIGISNFGRSSAVVNNIKRAKERGAKTIGITSAEGSPLMREVDMCFLTAFNIANVEYHTYNREFEPSSENIAQMVLLDCIYMNVAMRQDKSCINMFYNTVNELAKERL